MRSTTALLVLTAALFAPADASGADTPQDQAALLSAFAELKAHIQGSPSLDAKEVEAHKLTIDKHRKLFGANETIIKAALDLVATYDKVNGPLWVSGKSFSRGNRRKPTPPANDIHWTIFHVMQNIMDFVYSPENVAGHASVLAGFKFGSSAHFPGAVDPPDDPKAVYRVKIHASCPKPFVHRVQHEERPARRPTGAYVAPGSIVTVTVPKALVGKGYQVRVGANSWDLSAKPRVLRLDRVSLVYPIDSTEVKVANPLGGGIYIEVPLRADAAGVVEVAIRNAVRSPFFSATPFHRTTLDEWRDVERRHAAPWADFQSEKFMMQVPSSWIRKLDDPVTLMADWDRAMDAMNDLMGLPRVWGKVTMYQQVDLQLRGSAFFPGYPTCNVSYDPNRDYGGYANHYLVRGPQYAAGNVFHEAGHAYQFVKFAGERESTVNLLHVAIWQRQFGYSLDEAFSGSRGMQSNKFKTLDTTAVTWMTSLNFLAGKPMNEAEKAYQLKGHAKYVDVARLFGWKVLGDYWRSWVTDEQNGKTVSRHGTDIDVLSLRLSKSAGADLTPLLYFWGILPRDAKALKAAVAGAKLQPSAKIYDTLVHYKSLVPADNKAFREFARQWWGKQPSPTGYTTERGHAKQWDEYSEQTAAQIRKIVQDILDAYFPNGRPKG